MNFDKNLNVLINNTKFKDSYKLICSNYTIDKFEENIDNFIKAVKDRLKLDIDQYYFFKNTLLLYLELILNL